LHWKVGEESDGVVSLDPERWEADGLFDGSGISPREARKLVKGLQFAWLDEFGGTPTTLST